MKEIKKILLEYKEINFQYGDELITIKSEPFKTLENIKMKAIKRMSNIPPNNIHLFYLGLDITKNIRKRVGDLFTHCKKITIKLKSIENSNNTSLSIDKTNKSNSLTKTNKINLMTTQKTNNININKKLKIKSLIIKDNKFPSLYSNYTKNYVFNGLKKHKVLENKNESSSFFHNNSQKVFPVLNKSIFDNTKREEKFYCKCKKNIISYYCRNCKLLICNNCKANEKHKNHLMANLNSDKYLEDIINYGNSIQKEIIDTINIHKTLLEKLDILSYSSLSKEKEEFMDKYQKMIDKYVNISNKVEKYLNNKENEEIIKLKIESYNELLLKLNNEINNLMTNAKFKKINFNNLENILNEINNKEELISIFNKEILKYHIINEINTKIKSSIKLIEKEIEELVGKEIPFNLNNQFYEELINMKIIELPKKEEDTEKDKRISIVIGGHEISQSILNKRRKNIFSLYKEKEKEELEQDEYYY